YRQSRTGNWYRQLAGPASEFQDVAGCLAGCLAGEFHIVRQVRMDRKKRVIECGMIVEIGTQHRRIRLPSRSRQQASTTDQSILAGRALSLRSGRPQPLASDAGSRSPWNPAEPQERTVPEGRPRSGK